ncbi:MULTISPECIES: hypothetical protein [Streptomyces]|uniref:Uncharacterized protein n=2 Tax=Streptomyces rimosus subsp. rimosus TaxID=132474 RepID=A0A8A1UJ29_STRR1|nr:MULTISPECIES: hypothetical protein [Streptomyces]MYT44885.1 hypothetical protein [Streptomyces sp. SID5471]QGY70371.1 hypothetical protein V519_034880 [Streptomyces rimosus R6-500]QST80736.1 hypothetical protein SRIM_011615 [Streptomyces rimosus subsp. rimosus ATCC 10970]UNZ06269.1 hypothetical protein SRIMR7_29385 [Streptomyces rimosus subsp. rimosus]UTH97725.1 hypothetical protein SRIMHP_26760 [Streptomyces rimosus subsp. rimosus]
MSTFSGGGHWRRPSDCGQARSLREAQDRAAFDHDPGSGCSLLLLLTAVVAVVLGVFAG